MYIAIFCYLNIEPLFLIKHSTKSNRVHNKTTITNEIVLDWIQFLLQSVKNIFLINKRFGLYTFYTIWVPTSGLSDLMDNIFYSGAEFTKTVQLRKD